jgi:hypothetical protein
LSSGDHEQLLTTAFQISKPTTKQEVVVTNDFNLDRFRSFATEARSRPSFEAPPLLFSWKTGIWTTGKGEKTIERNGQKLAADVPDVMVGFQRWYPDTRQWDFHIVRVADGTPEPERKELGDVDEASWLGDKDPWQFVRCLPLFDPETHEVYVFSALGFSGANAIASMTDSWADTVEAEPKNANSVPVVELGSEKRVGSDSFNPTLDICSWIKRPAAVRHILPPRAAVAKPKPKPEFDDAVEF